MAEEKQQQDRTEQATPKRLQDARKKGDVPRSRELTMTGVMLAGATYILFLSAPVADRLVQGFSSALTIERHRVFEAKFLPEALAAAVMDAAWALAPFALALLCAVFASATLIGGWSFSFSAAAFKAGRMNPVKGIKRIFSANSLMELLKALAKFGIVAAIAISWLWVSFDDVLMLGRQPIGPAVHSAVRICGFSLLVTSAGLILIAMADVPFQLWNYHKKLKMTRTEVRDEYKDSEGRPEVKSRIRVLQQRIATRRMMEDVPTADVVITNPTQYAVALKYDDSAAGAPKVVAKGKDLVAAKIREIADASGVAIFSAPPLARALFRSTDIGQEIPMGLYTAVAQVLAYIFQIRDGHKPGQKYPERPVPEVDESEY